MCVIVECNLFSGCLNPQIPQDNSRILSHCATSATADVCFAVIHNLNRETAEELGPVTLTGEPHAAVPGTLDVSWGRRLDLWTDLPQHVAVLLSLKLRRAHYSFTPNL